MDSPGRAGVEDDGEWEDDCVGNVVEAEQRLYQRIVDYTQRSNLMTLFKLINKKGVSKPNRTPIWTITPNPRQ